MGWISSGSAGDGEGEAQGDSGDGVAGDGDLGGDFWGGALVLGLEVEDGGAGAAVGGAVAGTLAFELEGALILFSGGGVGDGAVEVSFEDQFVLNVAPGVDGGVVVEALGGDEGSLEVGGDELGVGGDDGDASEIDVIFSGSGVDADKGGVDVFGREDEDAVAEVAALGVGIDAGGAVVEGGVFVGELDGAAEGAVAADGDGLGDRVLGDGEEGEEEGDRFFEVHGYLGFGFGVG